MSRINRQAIVRGPGTVKVGSVSLFDASGITAEVATPTQEIPGSLVGPLDTIKTDQTATIQLTPVGEVTSDILSLLFPHQSPVLGSSIFGSSDTALIVHSRAGTKVTFSATALTGIPELRLSPVQTPFGQATFTAIVGNGKLPTDTDAVYKAETATYNGGNPDPTKLMTGKVYTASWGSLDIDDTVNGFTVTVEPAFEDVTDDSAGTIDKTLSGITVRARCQPLGLSESQILAALHGPAARGSSIASANDLVITAEGGLTVTLKNAALVTGPIQWGNATLRAGELGFVAHIDLTSGKLYEVAITPSQSQS